MARTRPDSPPLIELPSAPDFALERAIMRKGFWPVAGVDEVGRGPLAGPVVAAAVVLDPRRIPKGLDDSKRLSTAEREALFIEIAKRALAVAVASVSATGIDETDIRKASLEAMRRACAALTVAPAHVIVDGRDKVPGLSCACTAVVKGDQRSQSVAAASIVAKVTRDRMMRRCALEHPHYGFEMHVGYATRVHRDAISARGAVARLHRLSFSPFRLDGEQADEFPELGL